MTYKEIGEQIGSMSKFLVDIEIHGTNNHYHMELYWDYFQKLKLCLNPYERLKHNTIIYQIMLNNDIFESELINEYADKIKRDRSLIEKILAPVRNYIDSKVDFNKIHSIDIEYLCQRLGLKVEYHKISCPFHDEDTPSCKLYTSSNTFYCFGCNKRGDGLDLVMQVKKLGAKSALSFLLE